MRRRQTRGWQRAAFLAAFAAAMSVGTWQLSTGLSAQSAASSGIPNLSGTYTTYRPGGGRGRGSGEGVVSLNARAKAIIAAFDEGAGPKWDCVASALPRLVTEPYNFRIEQQADRVLLYYEKDDVVRTVWLEGHGHPKPKTGEYFLQGYSTGRYEGNQLVVETTKFVYDPHGITDNSPFIPSSQRKKVTERYSRDGTLLRVAVVTEDPLILTKPQEFVHLAEPTTDEWVPFECDIETSHEVLKFLPQKYGHP